MQPSIKQVLFAQCLNFVEDRIESSRQAMEMAQASANDETKSSAGDKYETGRAMAQLEIEKSGAQLAEARKLREALEQVLPERETTIVQRGSLVFTNQGNYYVAISAGKLLVEGVAYYAISPASPLGEKLMKLKAGASVLLNGREFRIEKII